MGPFQPVPVVGGVAVVGVGAVVVVGGTVVVVGVVVVVTGADGLDWVTETVVVASDVRNSLAPLKMIFT